MTPPRPRPYVVFDDTALLALGSGNRRAAHLLVSGEEEGILIPVMSLYAAGQQRAEIIPYMGMLEVTFVPLNYPGLVSIHDSGLPAGAAHALACAGMLYSSPVHLATTEPARYKGSHIPAIDLTDQG